MTSERVNRLDLKLTHEECEALYKCSRILYDMADHVKNEQLATLKYHDTVYGASSWLNEVGDVLEYFADIEIVSITE